MAVRKSVHSRENTEQEIVIYRGPKGNVSLRAQFERETLWATQEQIALLFGTQRPAVTKHINNIFKEKELSENAVCSILEHTAKDGKQYKVKFYNLDMIIAIGYRVNSKQATSFRIWATETLREYLLHGYVLNRKALIESKYNTLKDLEKTVAFIQSVATRKYLGQDEMASLLSVIRDYTGSFALLNEFDSGSVALATSKRRMVSFTYEEARNALDVLKKDLLKSGDASELFGRERDQGLQSILGNIDQTFDGKELYKSIEERSAHLLYFVIKDHPLVDGNKRTGAFLFILFLKKNNALYKKNGEKKINDNALTALALLVAESDPKEKEQIIALITQLIK
jgi:prophage maintenance system killer protein/phage regulator Rha-like protein